MISRYYLRTLSDSRPLSLPVQNADRRYLSGSSLEGGGFCEMQIHNSASCLRDSDMPIKALQVLQSLTM
jgi:hypothetical protein